MSEQRQWLDVIKQDFDQHKGKGGFQVLFPNYRPDLSRVLANFLDLKFYDYRKNIMQAEGWNAGKISLQEMTDTLLTETSKSGLVVHNTEALLATKSDNERRQWLSEFFSIDWPNAIIIPLAIYQADTLEGHDRICDLEFVRLPKQSLLMQLSG